MFPIQSILNGLHQSPVSVHVLPFSNGGFGSMPDFLPISRPLRSLRDLSQGSPLFSRSITVTSDGSKTVRQETSRDADGNLVTTTTTTTRSTQKPDSFAQDQDKSEGMEDTSVRNNNAELMFKSVLEDMPSELKDILGLPGLVMSDMVKPDLQNKQKSRDGDVATFDQQSDVEQSDADDSDEDDSDDENDSEDSDEDSDDDDVDTVQGEEENDSTSDNYQSADNANSRLDENNDENSAANPKPYVVEVEKTVDFPSLGAVLQAVANELHISPKDMEVVAGKEAPIDDSDSSAETAEVQSGPSAVETAFKEAPSDAAAVEALEEAGYKVQNDKALQEQLAALESRLQ